MIFRIVRENTDMGLKEIIFPSSHKKVYSSSKLCYDKRETRAYYAHTELLNPPEKPKSWTSSQLQS